MHNETTILNILGGIANNTQSASSSSNLQFDRRRFTGPDNSYPFKDFPGETYPIKTQGSTRPDGRSNSEIRSMDIKLGPVFQANGSCYLEVGKTKIICAAYGPKPRSSLPSSSSPLSISVRFTPFSLPGGRWNPLNLGTLESTISQALHQSLTPAILATTKTDSLPIVDLHLTIIEWDSPISVGHCVLASSLSLALASVPIIGLVIGVTAGLPSPSSSSQEPLVDPTLHETSSLSSILDLSYIPAMKSVTNMSLRSISDIKTGSIDLDKFDDLLDYCKSKAEIMHELAINAIKESNLYNL
ncbi:ribosomal protein S5 domain 2-type protein [Phakopsora pachyrhizi]|uniref:Ribosomal protein S5 domain 2-type protein n=1 Tax=Phakopsora pachyrhizi TaxID=170000 RepID=A0AAV0AJX6_PHAPC|nr:ribosomal protein S5 domain 2-type protein [Phakopsora pachyrhizi]CAH7668161.1 ribosomal protein S5 domain 2-type protein [Phakopsora pachyrhizi]